MPKELKPYRKLIEAGCGGNTAEDLLNRKGVNYFNNPVVCELIGICQAKVNILTTLMKLNLLPTNMNDEDIQRILESAI